jgi:hypothetical protein
MRWGKLMIQLLFFSIFLLLISRFSIIRLW